MPERGLAVSGLEGLDCVVQETRHLPSVRPRVPTKQHGRATWRRAGVNSVPCLASPLMPPHLPCNITNGEDRCSQLLHHGLQLAAARELRGGDASHWSSPSCTKPRWHLSLARGVRVVWRHSQVLVASPLLFSGVAVAGGPSCRPFRSVPSGWRAKEAETGSHQSRLHSLVRDRSRRRGGHSREHGEPYAPGCRDYFDPATRGWAGTRKSWRWWKVNFINILFYLPSYCGKSGEKHYRDQLWA